MTSDLGSPYELNTLSCSVLSGKPFVGFTWHNPGTWEITKREYVIPFFPSLDQTQKFSEPPHLNPLAWLGP